MIRMVALHWLIASLYLFGVQDMFNASDNLAEHFEFLDQQPKIFPGEAIACWCTGIRHGCIEHDGNLSDGLVKTQRNAKKEASCIRDWMQVLSMVQFKGVLSLSRYHLHTQPDPSRSFVMNCNILWWKRPRTAAYGDPIKHVEVHAWSMHGMQWMYAWVLELVIFSERQLFPRKVLHGLSMELQPGKTTALVGASGSGKSTSVKLGLVKWIQIYIRALEIDFLLLNNVVKWSMSMRRPICLIWYRSRGSWFSDIMIPWKVQSWSMECLWKTGTWPICIDTWWLAQLYVHLMAEAQHQWLVCSSFWCDAIRHWWLKSLSCSILLCDKTFFMAFPIAVLILIPRTECKQSFPSSMDNLGWYDIICTKPTISHYINNMQYLALLYG